jgi:isocitrate dehydrogenase
MQIEPGRNVVTVVRGDGVGPEIADAVHHVLLQSGAPLDLREVEAGKIAADRGYQNGLLPETWEALRSSSALLKAPTLPPAPPHGRGWSDRAIRKHLGIHTVATRLRSADPWVATPAPGLDVLVVRPVDNGPVSESRISDDCHQSVHVTSRSVWERTCRSAFEQAAGLGRLRVSLLVPHDARIADEMLIPVFEGVASFYPWIAHDLQPSAGIVQRLSYGEQMDVLLVHGELGAILSEYAVVAGGSPFMRSDAAFGPRHAVFDAAHPAFPAIAGKGVANPSGLLLAAVQMLVHLGHSQHASMIENAWLKTLEEGLHPTDFYENGRSRMLVGLRDFAEAVVARLGDGPSERQVQFGPPRRPLRPETPEIAHPPEPRRWAGSDFWVEWDRDPGELARLVSKSLPVGIALESIDAQGVRLWPRPSGVQQGDLLRCRIRGSGLTDVNAVMTALRAAGLLDIFVRAEGLFTFGGRPGYSSAGE